jgi:predicted AAA+ superfamily ATPase
MTKNMYKCKEYIFPSGNIINIQGYEHHAIDELLKQGICETNIITGCKNVPSIWYYDKNGKKRRHFVDIYIPNQNRCIEVKSTWTAKLHDGNIQLKQHAGKELGYNYEIWIYDKEGNKLECYK